jgi:hypothetical protein
MVRSTWCSTKELSDQEMAAEGCGHRGLPANVQLGDARARGVPGLGPRTSGQMHKGGEFPTWVDTRPWTSANRASTGMTGTQ